MASPCSSVWLRLAPTQSCRPLATRSRTLRRATSADWHHLSFEMRGVEENMFATGQVLRAGGERILRAGKHHAPPVLSEHCQPFRGGDVDGPDRNQAMRAVVDNDFGGDPDGLLSLYYLSRCRRS